MDVASIRNQSSHLARKLGIAVPGHLPLLESSLALRPQEAIENRALSLSAIVAAAYGFSREGARDWLQREDLYSALSSPEMAYLASGQGDAREFQCQVEALCGFAWALGMLPALDFTRPAPNDLVSLFPNLKVEESAARFRSRSRLRPLSEILAAADVAFCLHWAIRQARLEGKPIPGRLVSPAVVERRRALEWALSSDDWDALSLDT